MKSSCCKRAETLTLRAVVVLSLISASYGQTFSVAATPSSLTISPGQQGVPVTITSSGDTHAGPISVTVTGLPSGIVASPLTVAPGSSGTLTLSASLSAGQEGFSPSDPSMTTSWATP